MGSAVDPGADVGGGALGIRNGVMADGIAVARADEIPTGGTNEAMYR